MKKEYAITVVAILALVGVRLVGGRLFYDPFISFFHQADYTSQPLPELTYGKYFLALFARFAVNGCLTLLIVKSVFNQVDLVKLTAILLAITFVVLLPILITLIMVGDMKHYHYLFYVRRILIHPVLALILIPAYMYHQKRIKLKTND